MTAKTQEKKADEEKADAKEEEIDLGARVSAWIRANPDPFIGLGIAIAYVGTLLGTARSLGFSRDEGCPQASDFGDTSDLLAIFEKNRDALIATVQSASQEKLDQPSPRITPMFKTLGEMAAFMGLHAAVHTGQITLIRRSLGRPPVV